MTEAEWLADGTARLAGIERYASVRQLRLIAAAHLRRVQGHWVHAEKKRCDDLIEAAADHPRPYADVRPELEARAGYSWRFTHILEDDGLAFAAADLRRLVGCYPAEPPSYPSDLIREVLGNPFRPVTASSDWLTDTVHALASGMYESRDFSATPILADALQDAGCVNDDILNHLRDPRLTHVRGCWVVDLVLGKE